MFSVWIQLFLESHRGIVSLWFVLARLPAETPCSLRQRKVSPFRFWDVMKTLNKKSCSKISKNRREYNTAQIGGQQLTTKGPNGANLKRNVLIVKQNVSCDFFMCLLFKKDLICIKFWHNNGNAMIQCGFYFKQVQPVVSKLLQF